MYQDILDHPYTINDTQLRAEVEALERSSGKSSNQDLDTHQQIKEENTLASRHYRFDKQEELEKLRLGRVMDFKEFIRLLNKIVPARYTGHYRGLLKLETWRATDHGGEWHYITAFPAGLTPEYSTMHVNEHGVATSEKYRGWRTVLLRLIMGGAITEEAANKVFGQPNGPEARRYRETLYNFRNG